jgi:pimeloyl-ACP methyl ester carboxylesterase
MQLTTRSLSLAAALVVGMAQAADLPLGAQESVVFLEYSPLSGSEEIARRSFSPLTVAELRKTADASGKHMRDQPLDLTQESFSLYVPSSAPPNGYSLLVFVSPLDVPLIPSSWHWVLDRHGTIVVSASKSGNSQPIWDRRMPLALAGAFNVMRRYPIDPKRIFIGGWSGGSRVAMRLALDYPDIFHGALLNAGSDPIATALSTLPTAKLLEQLQTESKIIYVTGDMDSVNLGADIASRQSMNAWCVFGTESQTMFHVGHEAPSAAYLDWALAQLESPLALKAGKLESCRSRIAAELASKMHSVRDLLDRGKSQLALKELRSIDQRYGGLAAPESIELFNSISLQVGLK